jgi:hypothetical protein
MLAFNVVLAENVTITVTGGDAFSVHSSGALLITLGGAVVQAFAPGSWKRCAIITAPAPPPGM